MQKIGCGIIEAVEYDDEYGNKCGETKIDRTMVGGDSYIWLCQACYNIKSGRGNRQDAIQR